ncbi:MAG: flavoprotein [bacterium]|nr:flavoprotein [bacterium]
MLKNKKIIVGVSGSIAAYKTPLLVSLLVSEGAEVKTVMTENARFFAGETTFKTLTKNPVYSSLFAPDADSDPGHIALSVWCDLFLIAPATADVISKVAAGICDDLLSTLALSVKNDKTIIVPAMNSAMWAKPVIKRNVEILKKDGYLFAGPVKGRLACGEDGEGRMPEPADILKEVRNYFG